MPIRLICLVLISLTGTFAQEFPPNLVADGIPPIPKEVRETAARYLDFRSAGFQSWHPKERRMLIATRFADTPQLHEVAMPGGARQLTFLPEPVAGGDWQPKSGKYIVFGQDVGGGEFYQLYRFDPAAGVITLMTDGKSRNGPARWSKSGKQISYTSTRRTGKTLTSTS